jgi:hypothetical protein
MFYYLTFKTEIAVHSTAIPALAAKQNLEVQVSLERLYFLYFLLNKRAEKINKCLNLLYAQNLFGLEKCQSGNC